MFIVVGIDGFPASEHALRFAIDESNLRALPLRIVCAWEVPALEYAGSAVTPTPDLLAGAQQHAEDLLADALRVARAAGVTAEARAVEGHAPQVLLEQAARARLLVVGSRGRSGLASILLGSVSSWLAHHATCPLTIVPDEAGAEDRS
jgi:nucleotide-binding universal stress UspA family protein